jgi:hypothetical protein
MATETAFAGLGMAHLAGNLVAMDGVGSVFGVLLRCGRVARLAGWLFQLDPVGL